MEGKSEASKSKLGGWLGGGRQAGLCEAGAAVGLEVGAAVGLEVGGQEASS